MGVLTSQESQGWPIHSVNLGGCLRCQLRRGAKFSSHPSPLSNRGPSMGQQQWGEWSASCWQPVHDWIVRWMAWLWFIYNLQGMIKLPEGNCNHYLRNVAVTKPTLIHVHTDPPPSNMAELCPFFHVSIGFATVPQEVLQQPGEIIRSFWICCPHQDFQTQHPELPDIQGALEQIQALSSVLHFWNNTAFIVFSFTASEQEKFRSTLRLSYCW